MALRKKVYGVKTPISAPIFDVHGVVITVSKIQKPVAAQSEIGNLGRLQLKLQFVSNQRDEFRIRGFSFGVSDGVSEEQF